MLGNNATYLHPKYFQPDANILDLAGLNKNDSYFIIRIVSLTAGHDIEGKHKGINIDLLRRIIDTLRRHGKVFITSEGELPTDLAIYQINIPNNRIHDFMAYANLFIGDSQTMCAEAGILGTPFIRYNDFVGKIEYLSELENVYNLGWGIKTTNSDKLFEV